MASVATDRPPSPALPVVASGVELDPSPAAFGTLRASDDIAGDGEALAARMADDGYLFLPGYLDRELVLAARRVVCERLAAEGHLAPGTPPEEAIARPGATIKFAPELAEGNVPLHKLLYGPGMLGLYERFLGGPARHFDFTWLRAVSPGRGTAPHGDSVFMNRGTPALYTAWVPLGDVSYDLGGLMVLENSHRLHEVRETYGSRDVDAYCENPAEAATDPWRGPGWHGVLSDDPAELRRQLGGRWLTNPFRAGDLLTFSIHTLHASLDNRSDRIRMSTDSRYQLASEPVDERWVGEHPIGHGPEAKRGMIC